MTIATCPRCDEQVRVPTGVGADATVQCPLCREEYSLAEPLRKLPPELLVVDSIAPPVDEVDIEGSWDTLEEAPDEVQPVNEFAFAPVAEGSKSAFDFDSGDAEGPSPVSSVRASARRSKPKGSPIKSILSIVIGGMMAFPIAQLILWYLPGDLKRDFGAGPVVAKYIPAIVPAKFRGQTADAADNSDSVIPDFSAAGSGAFAFSGEPEDSQPQKKKRGQNKRPQPNNTPPNLDPPGNSGFELPDMKNAFTEPGEGDNESAVTSLPGDDVLGVDLPNLDLADVDLADVDFPGVEVPDVEVPDVPVPGLSLPGGESPGLEIGPLTPNSDEPIRPATNDTAASGSPGVKVKGAPAYTPAEVAAAYSKALTANDAWDTAGESAVTNQQKTAFYKAMASLGEVATLHETSDQPAEQPADARRMLAEVGKQASKLDAIGAVESRWIALPPETRGSDGICLHGTVTSVEQRGELFETTLEHNGWSIPVITRDDPSDTITIGARLLVLGAIVSEPTDRLAGYEGDAEVVVLGGLQAAIEPE